MSNGTTYTISEISREFGVTARALRFYEDKALIAPRRDGQARIYGARERGRLQIILRCKRLGFPLSDIKEILDLYGAGDGDRVQMIVALRKYRQRLSDLKAQFEDVTNAIRETQSGIEWLEQRVPQALETAQ
jgi:DNA-binding transcriptional MerR regulator